MVEPTTTSEETKGKLPTDIKTAPDDGGKVDITKAIENEEATPKTKEAQKETKTEDKVVEAPKVEEKAFSQKELDERLAVLKGGYDGTVKELKNNLKLLTDDLETKKREAEDKSLNDWVKSIEDDGGNVDVAKKIVEREKAVKVTELAQTTMQAQLDTLAAKLSEAGKAKAADDLIKTHTLSEDVREELLKAEDLVQMENSALRLRLEAKEAETKLPETVGNAAQASTKGMDMSKIDPTRRLGMLADEYDRTGEMV